ncbi:MAG: membrane protein insertase YidC [Planctomycetota bacterium]|jgi:YidC/Oxa1 family membrane protein insertase
MNFKQKTALFIAVVATFLIIFIEQKNRNEEMIRKRAAQQQIKELKKRKIEQDRSLLKPSVTTRTKESAVSVSPETLPEKRKPQSTSSAPAETAAAQAAPAAGEAERVEEITVRNDNFEAVFTSRGAALKSYTLLKYFRTTEQEEHLDLLDRIDDHSTSIILDRIGSDTYLENFNYHITRKPSDESDPTENRLLEMEAVKNNWKITKTYTFAPALADPKNTDPVYNFGFTVNISVQNLSDETRPFSWEITALSGFIPDDTDSRYGAGQTLIGMTGAADDADLIQTTPFSEIADNAAELEEKNSPDAPLQYGKSGIDWAGMRGRFFATILNIETPELSKEISGHYISLKPSVSPYAEEFVKKYPVYKTFLDEQPHSAVLKWKSRDTAGSTVPSQAAKSISFSFYGGPVEEEFLLHNPEYANVVSYSFVGFFEPISRILIKLLKFIASYIPNYGIAIIVMTLILKTLLHGLTRKALASGHKMQKLQPILKQLKEKHKDSPRKMQEETMKLWREHGVSPMGSCFPMLIQIPIFIALFGVFSRTFAVRHAVFIPGWIDDLSQPEMLLNFGFTIPLVGWSHLNILPIVYAALQLVQQSMTPKSDDPQMAQQQAMMKFMPVFFMFIFYSMPSGLVLYFTISAGYTLVEHWFIRKKLDGGDEQKTSGGAKPAAAGTGFKKKKK